MKKKTIIILLTILAVVIGGAIYGYSIISSGFGIDKKVYVYVYEDKNYNNLLTQLENVAKIKNKSNFNRIATLLSYKDNMRTGRYAVTPDMTVLSLIRDLRNGHQEPVRLTFNNIRTKKDFAKRISEQLMSTETDLLSMLSDEKICESFGFDTQTIIAMFIPNTYEFYWNTSAKEFLTRMNKEYKKFWNQQRVAKAEAINLTPIQVSILASIVEEECTYSDEYPVVAGLYLNRLHIGQRLQADPTVKFAVGDFGLRRILNVHLQVESPYNTYLHEGLPPGPIRIPSIKGIDSVLNYDKNDYYYMCAKDDFSGRHNFAKTHAEHQIFAQRYRKALNERGIK